MSISADQLLERRNALIEERTKLMEQIHALTEDLNAVHGAVQECEYWLGQMNETEAQALTFSQEEGE